MGYTVAAWLGFGEALAAVTGALTGLLFVALSVRGCFSSTWLASGGGPKVESCTGARLVPGTPSARWRVT